MNAETSDFRETAKRLAIPIQRYDLKNPSAQIVGYSPNSSFDTGPKFEFFEQVADMNLDGAIHNVEIASDELVGHPMGQAFQNTELAVCEAGMATVRDDSFLP